MADQVSMCSVSAHLKQSAELGHCSSLPARVTFKFTARATFKFTPHLKLSLMTDQVLADICLQ